MLTSKTHTTEEQLRIAASPEVVRELVLDVAGWSQLHRPAVYAELVDSGPDGDLLQHWWVVGRDRVRTWRERRRVDDDRVTFVHEPAEQPWSEHRGGWSFEPRDGGVLVRMYREVVPAGGAPDPATVDAALDELRRADREYLETLRYAAEHRAELAERIISFDDPLFVAGSVRDAYTYLYEADKWPGRIPHVARLEMVEKVPDIQFFDMDTVSADGSRHTTRSVRICLPHRKIVYKQTEPPKTMDAHSGHWLFTETPEGLIVTSRHTVTIRPAGLHLLGPDTDIPGARRYMRRVLSANSMGNLRLTKAYAEERAGV